MVMVIAAAEPATESMVTSDLAAVKFNLVIE